MSSTSTITLRGLCQWGSANRNYPELCFHFSRSLCRYWEAVSQERSLGCAFLAPALLVSLSSSPKWSETFFFFSHAWLISVTLITLLCLFAGRFYSTSKALASSFSDFDAKSGITPLKSAWLVSLHLSSKSVRPSPCKILWSTDSRRPWQAVWSWARSSRTSCPACRSS